jgi:hypothetical protein
MIGWIAGNHPLVPYRSRSDVRRGITQRQTQTRHTLTHHFPQSATIMAASPGMAADVKPSAVVAKATSDKVSAIALMKTDRFKMLTFLMASSSFCSSERHYWR